MKNKSLLVISVLSLVVILLGGTFSYFNATARSNENAMGLTAMTFDTGVEVTALYNSKDLIPTNDADIMTAYAQNCIDDLGYGACHAYNIEVENNGLKTGYDGTIKFNLNGVENLKYMLLDENENVYVAGTGVVTGTDQTLGDSFELDTNESTNFILIIWLSNLENDDQSEVDAAGSFSAAVTYTSTTGTRITGTFSVSG